MGSNDLVSRTQDMRDAVKWISTSMITIGTAVAGAAVLSRLGGVPEGEQTIPVILAIAALVAITAAGAVCAWALSATEPSLSQLVPNLVNSAGEAPLKPRKLNRRRKRLLADIQMANPVAQYKHQHIADLAEQLDRRRASLLDATQKAENTDALALVWKEKLPELNEKLESAYSDLREVADAIKLVRTRRRARVAIPLVVCFGVAAIAAIIPFVLLSQPGALRPAVSSVNNLTEVQVKFVVDPTSAKSQDGCVPARTDTAVAAGGSWLRPLLIFTATADQGSCRLGMSWSWYPVRDGDVLVLPKPQPGKP